MVRAIIFRKLIYEKYPKMNELNYFFNLFEFVCTYVNIVFSYWEIYSIRYINYFSIKLINGYLLVIIYYFLLLLNTK